MDHVHKRFTTEQVRVLIKGYCQGTLDRSAIQETLHELGREYINSFDGVNIGSRFFYLPKG